jgi:hypothetical protein
MKTALKQVASRALAAISRVTFIHKRVLLITVPLLGNILVHKAITLRRQDAN